MNKEEYKTGLWQQTSQKGLKYYYGKIKIGEAEYQLTLFKNNKTNDKQPDLNIIIRNKLKEDKSSEQIFAEFGEITEVTDEDLAF